MKEGAVQNGAWAGRIARMAVWLVPVSLAVWLVLDALAIRIPLPMPFSYVEGFNVGDSARLARGEALYGDPSRPPFIVSVYTPLYTAIVAFMIKLGLPGLLCGRIVSLLSATLVAVAVAVTGWRRTGAVALVAAALFLLAPVQASWTLVARPDYSAALLSILGILVVDAGAAGIGPLLLAGLLFALAALTKQSYLAAPAAAAIFLMWRAPRRGAAFAAIFAALLGGAVAALYWATHGWFFFHTVVANRNPFSWADVGLLGGRFLAGQAPELILLLPAAVAVGAARRGSIFGIYAVLASLVSLSVGKIGSDSNYFIEPLAAGALLAAHEYPVTWLRRREGRQRTVLAALGAAAVALSLIRALETYPLRRDLPAVSVVFERMCRDLSSRPGPAISDDAVLLACAGKEVWFQPFVMTQLAEAGDWDQTPLVEALAQGRIRTVIAKLSPDWLFRERYTEKMRTLILTRYRTVAMYNVDLSVYDLTVLTAETGTPAGAGSGRSP